MQKNEVEKSREILGHDSLGENCWYNGGRMFSTSQPFFFQIKHFFSSDFFCHYFSKVLASSWGQIMCQNILAQKLNLAKIGQKLHNFGSKTFIFDQFGTFRLPGFKPDHSDYYKDYNESHFEWCASKVVHAQNQRCPKSLPGGPHVAGWISVGPHLTTKLAAGRILFILWIKPRGPVKIWSRAAFGPRAVLWTCLV